MQGGYEDVVTSIHHGSMIVPVPGQGSEPTLEGHTSVGNLVALSADGQVLATGSSDQTARLRSAETGEMHQALEGTRRCQYGKVIAMARAQLAPLLPQEIGREQTTTTPTTTTSPPPTDHHEPQSPTTDHQHHHHNQLPAFRLPTTTTATPPPTPTDHHEPTTNHRPPPPTDATDARHAEAAQ